MNLRLVEFKNWHLGSTWINPEDVSTVRVERFDGSSPQVKSTVRMRSGWELVLEGDFVEKLRELGEPFDVEVVKG